MVGGDMAGIKARIPPSKRRVVPVLLGLSTIACPIASSPRTYNDHETLAHWMYLRQIDNTYILRALPFEINRIFYVIEACFRCEGLENAVCSIHLMRSGEASQERSNDQQGEKA
jgi:hypothetical protein